MIYYTQYSQRHKLSTCAFACLLALIMILVVPAFASRGTAVNDSGFPESGKLYTYLGRVEATLENIQKDVDESKNNIKEIKETTNKLLLEVNQIPKQFENMDDSIENMDDSIEKQTVRVEKIESRLWYFVYGTLGILATFVLTTFFKMDRDR